MDGSYIVLKLCFWATGAQVIVGDTEVAGIPAEIFFVFFIRGLFRIGNTGKFLPLFVNGNGHRSALDGRRGFLCAECLHDNIIGKIVFFAGIDSYCFGGCYRLNRLLFLFLNIFSYKGNGFRAENRKAGSIGEGNILKIYRA